jgi:glutathione S-transferase
VPVIELDDGRVMAESNAILCWLADGTSYFAGDSWQRAQALSWMFFEQYSHEPCIAVARFICGWTPLDSPRRADLPALRERGHHALAVMERHLLAASWFTGAEYGIADIALFGYTDVASEGGFDLARYPAVRDWLARVRGTPGFVSMPPTVPDAAALIAQSV